MSYAGVTAPIRIGRAGLLTDLNDSDIPDTNLVVSENCELKNGLIEKEPGSRRWNAAALPASVRALLDWYPADSVQRVLAVTDDGKFWKFNDSVNVSEITAYSVASPTTLVMSPHVPIQLVAGGNESPGETRKAFVFSGLNQVQVLEADESTRRNVSEPAVDWAAGNFPRGGVVHMNRLWAFLDHRIWASSPTDHEKFITGAIQFAVYPGESERIVAAYVYRKKLFVFKRPKGVYMLVDDDPSTSNWYFTRISDEFGAAGPQSIATMKDDMLVANAFGSITSARAVEQAAGDLNSGDIFGLLKVQNYFTLNMSLEDLDLRQMIYYPDRQAGYMAYRSASGYQNDRMLKIDMALQRPELTVITKDQVNCFMLKQIINGRKIPYYGSSDGYIYEMDRPDRDVAGNAYSLKIRTPNLNFGYIDPSYAAVNKNFDAVQFEFVPTGRWDVTVNYFVDGKFVKTFTFQPSKGAVLGDFILDDDRLSSPSSAIITKTLGGFGRTMSLEIILGGVRQNIKLSAIRVLFRPANVDDSETTSGR